jgi:hypothetical protein
VTEEEFGKIVREAMVVVEKYSIPLFLFQAGAESTGIGQIATGCLLQTAHGVALITSGHVLRHYADMNEEGRLQLGKNRFVMRRIDPRSPSIGHSEIGALWLTEEEVVRLAVPVLPQDQVIMKPVRQFKLVAFSGYPGATKALEGRGIVSVSKHQMIGAVDTVEHDQFSIRTDESRYDWEPLAAGNDQEHYPLGGISGSPVFSLVTGAPHLTTRRRPAVVGWVHEALSWSRNESKIYAVHAAALSEVL